MLPTPVDSFRPRTYHSTGVPPGCRWSGWGCPMMRGRASGLPRCKWVPSQLGWADRILATSREFKQVRVTRTDCTKAMLAAARPNQTRPVAEGNGMLEGRADRGRQRKMLRVRRRDVACPAASWGCQRRAAVATGRPASRRLRGSPCWRARRHLGMPALMGRGGELCGHGLPFGGIIGLGHRYGYGTCRGVLLRACGGAQPLDRGGLWFV